MLYCKHPNKLAQLRQNAHLSQKQLAQKLGVSQASINYWENGQRTPSVKAAQKISDYFKMPISEIFSPYKEEINITNIVNAAEKLQLRGKLMMIYHPLFLLQKNTLSRNFKVYKTMPPF